MVNISAGDDFSKRYFYTGKCVHSANGECKTLKFNHVKLTAPHPAKLLVVVNDQRPQFVGQFNNEPVSIKLDIVESTKG